ncbi:MAG: tRNA (adenosine(37)-N6)-threonylcarbamoyltransferase complex dimerization subunit type 1 TsaB [Caldithrix sp.]|nr:tRNA (adenosine(37)-N6)-threonylcarbamoyltransferase complex dimerization subunit type 1 TsaB [Caldithrix sp.]
MILAIETSSHLCSVAFWQDGRVLLQYNLDMPMQHAELLAKIVDEGLRFLSEKPIKTPCSVKDIQLVGVGIGPGSFTGLRIGLSYAQGFCFASQIPIAGISSHQIFAGQSITGYDTVFTIIDARRNEVYCAELSLSSTGYWAIINHQILNKTELGNALPDTCQLICSKDIKLEQEIKAQLHEKHILINTNGHLTADIVAVMAQYKFQMHGGDDLQTLEPMYIRSFAGVL